jgi:uncharacterized membrane protein
MDLFNFHLSFIPLFLLVPITLGLAIFYIAPLYSSSLAVYYNRLIYQEEGVVPDAPSVSPKHKNVSKAFNWLLLEPLAPATVAAWYPLKTLPPVQ